MSRVGIVVDPQHLENYKSALTENGYDCNHPTSFVGDTALVTVETDDVEKLLNFVKHLKRKFDKNLH